MPFSRSSIELDGGIYGGNDESGVTGDLRPLLPQLDLVLAESDPMFTSMQGKSLTVVKL